MDYTIRPLQGDETLFIYSMPTAVNEAACCIGYLRGTLDMFGKFNSTFFPTPAHSRSEEYLNGDGIFAQSFTDTLNNVIYSLRKKGGLLADFRSLCSCGCKHPDALMLEKRAIYYGYRVDANEYTFILRTYADTDDYNLYCFCFVRKWFDKYLTESPLITFYDPNTRTNLFSIRNGESVRIVSDKEDESPEEYICYYVDDEKAVIGTECCIISEFLSKQNAKSIIPIRTRALPEKCFAYRRSDDEIVLIRRGETGYLPGEEYMTNAEKRIIDARGLKGEDAVAFLNGSTCPSVSKAQERAMIVGCIMGWDTADADPSKYSDNDAEDSPDNK